MPGQTDDTAPDQKAVREVVSLLQRAYRERQLYPPDHPSSTTGVASFITCLNLYLDTHENLSLVVRESSLESGEAEVGVGSGAGRENLAFLMFGDGIRKVVFSPGVDRDEIEAFIDCLAQADGLDRNDYDLVTLLWEADLSHIDYAVADPFSQGEYLPGDTVKNLSDLVLSKMNALDLALDGTQPGEASSVAGVEGFGALRDFVLSTSEQADLDRLASQKPELASEFRQVLLEVTAAAPTERAAERASRAYAALLGPSLREGKTEEAEEALEDFSAALRDNPAKEALLGAAVSATGEAGDLEGTLALLESPDAEVRAKTQQFLQRIARWAFATLLARLAETESTIARKSLLDILGNTRPLPVALLADQLRDERWYVVRNAVVLLGTEHHDPVALSLLGSTASHPDERVRREVVRALSSLDEPRTIALLTLFLRDDAPAVRVLAARSLARSEATSCLGNLEQIACSKEFCRRTPDEVAAFFDAYADIAKGDAVPLLDGMWRRKTLRRNRPLEVRVAAVAALSRISSDAARRSLQDAAGTREQAVSKTARRCLSSWDDRGRTPDRTQGAVKP